MIRLASRDLDTRVRIERRIEDTGFRSAGSETWVLVDEAWASVVDDLPSRTEKIDGIASAVRRSRVRMRYRTDITPDLRLVVGDRLLQIVSPAAQLGRRAGIEVVVEEYSA